MESTISDLLESKNRLAYEKGQLQNRVDQLQRDLQSMENLQKDALKQTRVKSEIEIKLKEVDSFLFFSIFVNKPNIVSVNDYFLSSLYIVSFTLNKKWNNKALLTSVRAIRNILPSFSTPGNIYIVSP